MEKDNYAIYLLQGKMVSVSMPDRFFKGKGKVVGLVSRVFRDVIHHKIHVQIGNNCFVFPEPNKIKVDGNDLIFVYGGNNMDTSDAAFYEELRRVGNKGGDVGMALDNLLDDELLVVRFMTGGYATSSIQSSKRRRYKARRKSHDRAKVPAVD